MKKKISDKKIIGIAEEEQGKGIIQRDEALIMIHFTLVPSLYFEIGVRKCGSLRFAKCPSIGIDPKPHRCSVPDSTIYAMTSDSFFANMPSGPIHPDLMFIDGLHLFEQALRDFINCEGLVGSGREMIVFDDIFPAHPSQASRTRRTSKWTGDVWKVFPTLKKWRPDLHLYPVDSFPTGLLLVTNLDSNNTVLKDNYDLILAEYADDDTLPSEILLRHGARALTPENFLHFVEGLEWE